MQTVNTLSLQNRELTLVTRAWCLSQSKYQEPPNSNPTKIKIVSVLLVPGTCFSTVSGPNPYVRAAYSLPNEEAMNEGFKRLAKLIRENS